MTDFADQPLDTTDQEVIDRLAAVHARLDPPPGRPRRAGPVRHRAA